MSPTRHHSKLAVYPGSFDPVTKGHLDILYRAIEIFDKVTIAIARNINKAGLFTPEERAELINQAIGKSSRVEVDVFDNLLADYVTQKGANTIIRGLRAVADFEYEFQLALMNRKMKPNLDTIFLMTDQENFFVSSSLVKEIARFGGDVSPFVPENVCKALGAKFPDVLCPRYGAGSTLK